MNKTTPLQQPEPQPQPQQQGPKVPPEALKAAQTLDDELGALSKSRAEHNELASALRLLVMLIEKQGEEIAKLNPDAAKK
jgi:hypothetical protein